VVLGLPFNLFWLMSWMVLTPVCMAIAYRVEKSRDRAAAGTGVPGGRDGWRVGARADDSALMLDFSNAQSLVTQRETAAASPAKIPRGAGARRPPAR
jgi:hypothetical protein